MLSQVLLTRPQAGLLTTDAVLALRVHTKAMDSIARALGHTVANSNRDRAELCGVVRVTASEMVGAEVLPPLIARLRRTCPDIVIGLMLSNRFQDLPYREVDITMRIVIPQQEQLVTRRLGGIEPGLYTTIAYLTRQGLSVTPNGLAGHALIDFDSAIPLIRRALQAYPRFQYETFAVRTDNNLAQLSLIRAGAGIGIYQMPLANGITPLQRMLASNFSLNLDI